MSPKNTVNIEELKFESKSKNILDNQRRKLSFIDSLSPSMHASYTKKRTEIETGYNTPFKLTRPNSPFTNNHTP